MISCSASLHEVVELRKCYLAQYCKNKQQKTNKQTKKQKTTNKTKQNKKYPTSRIETILKKCLTGETTAPLLATFKWLHKEYTQGGADGRVVKVLDCQPRDRGFESRHTLGLWARFVPHMYLEVIVNMQLLASRTP